MGVDGNTQGQAAQSASLECNKMVDTSVFTIEECLAALLFWVHERH